MRKRERKLLKNGDMHLMAAELQNFAALRAPSREDINKQINFGQVPSKNSCSLALQGTTAT